MAMYHYQILYLSSNLTLTPRANMTADKTNFQWTLTHWLNNTSTPDSQVWIWIFSHGTGLHHQPPQPQFPDLPEWRLDGGRNETNSDEGAEIPGYLIGIDSATWFGVDEGICLPSEEVVWDDDFRQWLEDVNYRRLVIFMGTCKGPDPNDTSSCFGGGFIDDLSAPRRIIISCTNETYDGWVNKTTGIGFFEGPFMEALTPYTQAWYIARDLIDYDGNTSVLEAYTYAYEHDMARKAVRISYAGGYDPWEGVYPNYLLIDESPWMDDGGDFLPSFRNCSDVSVGGCGYSEGDSWLAEYTWLDISRYSGCVEDVNDDFKVDLIDLYMTSQNFGCLYPANWNSQCSLVDINEDNHIDLIDYFAIALMYGWTA